MNNLNLLFLTCNFLLRFCYQLQISCNCMMYKMHAVISYNHNCTLQIVLVSRRLLIYMAVWNYCQVLNHIFNNTFRMKYYFYYFIWMLYFYCYILFLREVVEGDEFLSLSSEQVVKLISSDELTVPSEEKVGY